MAKLTNITEYIDREFALREFQDASLNGLQVEGAAEVTKIAAAVDAGISIIEKCVQSKANLLIVHHGIFWGKDRAVRGPHKTCIKTLLDNQISLLAVHLPLDAHIRYGNNALLANTLGLSQVRAAALYNGKQIGVCAENSEGKPLEAIAEQLASLPGAVDNFVRLPFGPKTPKNICIVSGSGADQLQNYLLDEFDTLITGEPKQFAYHFCKEHRLNALFPGHYATETLGVKKTAELLSQQFQIPWEFIDEPTGI